jgi:hypothetical protein
MYLGGEICIRLYESCNRQHLQGEEVEEEVGNLFSWHHCLDMIIISFCLLDAPNSEGVEKHHEEISSLEHSIDCVYWQNRPRKSFFPSRIVVFSLFK